MCFIIKQTSPNSLEYFKKKHALAETFEILPCEFRSTKLTSFEKKSLKKSLNTS